MYIWVSVLFTISGIHWGSLNVSPIDKGEITVPILFPYTWINVPDSSSFPFSDYMCVIIRVIFYKYSLRIYSDSLLPNSCH